LQNLRSMDNKGIVEKVSENRDNILNVLAIGSGIYIIGNLVSYFHQIFKSKSEMREIRKIIKEEKEKLDYLNNSTKEMKIKLAYSCYLKILNKLYHHQFVSFDKERSSLFNTNDLDKYINCVEVFNHNMKEKEQNILKEVTSELSIDWDLPRDDKNEIIKFA